MSSLRTQDEVDALIELVRMYCTAAAAYKSARDEGRLSIEEQSAMQCWLARMDGKIELLKSRKDTWQNQTRTAMNRPPFAAIQRRSLPADELV